MVGRNRRQHGQAERVIPSVEEDEIVILDIPAKVNRKKKADVKEMDRKTPEENILDGIDLDGASEQERQELKLALAASMREQSHPKYGHVEERSFKGSHNPDQEQNNNTPQQESDMETERDSDQQQQQQQHSIGGYDDDDETQPPSSDVELDLSKSTSDIFYLSEPDEKKMNSTYIVRGNIEKTEEKDDSDVTMKSDDEAEGDVTLQNSAMEIDGNLTVGTDEDNPNQNNNAVVTRKTANAHVDVQKHSNRGLSSDKNRGSVAKKTLRQQKHNAVEIDSDMEGTVPDAFGKRNRQNGQKVAKKHKQETFTVETDSDTDSTNSFVRDKLGKGNAQDVRHEEIKQEIKTETDGSSVREDQTTASEGEEDTTWQFPNSQESQEEEVDEPVTSTGVNIKEEPTHYQHKKIVSNTSETSQSKYKVKSTLTLSRKTRGTASQEPKENSNSGDVKSSAYSTSEKDLKASANKELKEGSGLFESLNSRNQASGDSELKTSSQGFQGQTSRSHSQQSSRSNSQQSSRSNSQHGQQGSRPSSRNSEIGFDHVPLHRHYRAVLPEVLHQDRYYAIDETVPAEQSMKAIYQLFEIYRTKLREAQRKCNGKLGWGESVKSGQHQDNTIDVKKRGKEFVSLEVSDEEGNSQKEQKAEVVIEQKPQETRYGRKLKPVHRTGADIEEDLPDLLIEEEHTSKNYNVAIGNLKRPPLHSKKEIMSAETHLYDFNDADDFVNDGKSSNLGKRTSRGEMRGAENTKASHSASGYREDHRETLDIEKGELFKRLQQNQLQAMSGNLRFTRQRLLENRKFDEIFGNTNIHVEETQQQEERDMKEAIRRSKLDSQAVVLETQNQENGVDWLNVSCDNGKEGFENPVHRAKLQGYSIPKKQNLQKEQIKEVGDKTNARADARPGRGRKRKVDQPKAQTLVEDTQDLDAEVANLNFKRKRPEKNCFVIKSDSENESVPDSQEAPAEQKPDSSQSSSQGEPKRKSPGLLGTMFNTVKKMLTPAKSFEDNEKNITESDGSRDGSPVLNKKTSKLYSNKSKKFFSCPVQENEPDSEQQQLEQEETAFATYKSSSKEKKHNAGSNSQTYSRQMPVESDLIEENGIPPGVRKLFSRPSSKDSVASDNQPSSQMSSTMLDEKGDLYSTQYCEIKLRKGKNMPAKTKCEGENAEPEAVIHSLIESDSEDVPDIKFAKSKAYVVKKQPSKQKNNVKNDSQNNVKISNYFGRKPDVNEEISIDSDDESNVGLPTKNPASIYDIDQESENEDPLVNVKQGQSRNNSQERGRVDLPNSHLKSNNQRAQNNIKQQFNWHNRGQNHVQDLNIDRDNPPVMLTNFNKGSKSRQTIREGDFGVAMQEHRILVKEEQVHNEGPTVPKRRRNVSETITSSEYETGVRRVTRASEIVHSGRHSPGGEMWGNLGTGVKSRRGQQQAEEVTIKEVMVDCPICSRHFGVSIIQQHAATCNNTPEEQDQDAGLESYLTQAKQQQQHLSQQQLNDHLVPEEHMANFEHFPHHDHPNLQGGFIQDPNHPGAFQGHPQEDDEVVDAELSHIMENDENVKDLARKISCSPGEEGELTACFVCDAPLEKNKFDQHVKLCLARATKQAKELEQEGFKKVFQASEPENPGRVLRDRREGERSTTPRMRPRGITPVNTPTRQHQGEEHYIKTEEQEVQGRGRPGRRRIARLGLENEAAMPLDGYTSGENITESDETEGSSWDDGSSTSGSDSNDDNITIASVVRSGSSALITGPWNYNSKNRNQSLNSNKTVNQSDCNNIPDWVRNGMNSPIKTFVPISQQEDVEYFQQQFGYKRDRVENTMNKRKRSQTSGKKRRRKRRKVRRNKTKNMRNTKNI